MGLRTAAVAALTASLAAGCASSRPVLVRRATQGNPPRGARADFSPGRFDEVFAAAVALVRDRGHAVAACDAAMGALVTAPFELDARCGETTCLARETASVKLGYRRARVTLVREVWDPTLRAWAVQEDGSTVDELSRAERELAAGMVESRQAASEGEDPCAPARCAGVACVAASGWAMR